MIRRFITTCCLVSLFIFGNDGTAVAEFANPLGEGSGGNTLVAAGPNNLTVTESITDLGGGTWEYTYDITSFDPSNVWHFLVYTSFSTSSATATTFPNVASSVSLDTVFAEYDARNIDAGLTDATSAWFTPFGGSNGIMTGGTGSLTFLANVFDDSAKLFAYETGASGYAANNGGTVAAFGYTGVVPTPSSFALLGMGAVSLLGFRKRRKTEMAA